MAKKYTVSTFKTREAFGDSPNNNNMISSGTLTITPLRGYVIKSSDFSVPPTSLPYGVNKVTFSDVGKANTPSNTVLATVFLDTNFMMPDSNVHFKLSIRGKSTLYKSIGLDAIVVLKDLKDTGSTYATATITSARGSNIIKTDNYSGYQQNGVSEDSHTIVTSCFANNRVKIASVHIKADDGYYFLKKPYLKNNNNVGDIIKMKLIKTIVDSNVRTKKKQITDYYFDITYKNSKATSVSSHITSTLIYSAIEQNSIITKTPEITDVIFGGSTISTSGENRPITVIGTPGGKFKLTLTRKSTGQSILDSSIANSNVTDPVSGKIDALYKVIPRSGKCYFNQTFPNITSNETTITSNMSSTATMPLTDTTGIIKGDKLIIKSIDYTATTTVDVVNSATQVTLASAISATKGDVVSFVRSDEYYLNIIGAKVFLPHLISSSRSYTSSTDLDHAIVTTTLSSNIPERTPSSHARRDYNYLFTQDLKPILKITATESNANLNPTGVSTITRVGIAGRDANNLNSKVYPQKFSVSWSMVAHNAHDKVRTLTSGSINDDGIMSFSNTDQTLSDWTNSVPADNGGTKIIITNITQTDTSTAGADTYYLKFDVIVVKWGTSDVTMNVNLDDMVETYAS